MRITVVALACLFAASCSTADASCRCRDQDRARHVFVDSDDDGLPDARVSLGAAEAGQTRVVFLDEDGDSLPDKRIVGVVRRGGDGEDVLVSRDALIALPRASRDDDRLREALEKLERAIAEVRRAMR
ncbi:MAG: hypothetical protein KAI24_03685 [Planctomycetes bacterium]|nr:hypothetical protein [Planctomycetota bacterium]